MNPLIAIMLLVTCDDSFTHCHVAKDMLAKYTSPQQCERELETRIVAISSRDQQILGKCLPMRTSINREDPISVLHWNVTKDGDFYTQIEKRLPKKNRKLALNDLDCKR